MRARLAAIAAATALLAMAIGAPALAASGPFTGTWYAIDVDGSQQKLSFSATESTFVYVDSRATFCGGAAIRAAGTATVTDDTAQLDGLMGCAGDPLTIPFSDLLTFEPATGTLAGAGGVTWSRGRALEAFLGTWQATDVDGSAMRLSFGGTGLSRDVAYVDHLASACDPDAPFSATGTGLIGSVSGDGRFIEIWMTGQCDGSGTTFSTHDKYEYVLASNTLRGPLVPEAIGGTDGPGTVTWHR